MEITGYVASEEGFFNAPCYIDCSAMKYCAFPDADRVLGIDRVYDKKMVDIGEGILVSEPMVVEKKLKVKGDYFMVSLSHQGVLAIFSYYGGNIIQFTNLENGKQVEVKVENYSSVAFYDDKMILLTYREPLREARVEEVFDKRDNSVFKKIGNVDEIDFYADTSLPHSRRVLNYRSPDYILYEFNVDTKENKRIEIDQSVWMFPSLMGIDCGVKVVFQEDYNGFAYILGWDNNTTPLHEVREKGCISILFASTTNPKDLSKCMVKYNHSLTKGKSEIKLQEPIYFESGHSVARIYKDIFLLFDHNTNKWVLSRIIIP